MHRLPPEVLEAYKDGQFVAKLSHGKFNDVWMDYTIEATENKALKGAGGIIGLTLKGQALVRLFLSIPITAQYSEQMRKNISKSDETGQQRLPGRSTAATKRWILMSESLVVCLEGHT